MEFHNEAGETCDAFMTVGPEQRLREGDTVTVLHEPGNPDSARVPSFALLWLAPLIALGAGAAGTAVGLASLLLRR